ncbi:hypothetical protein GGP85_003272 [Salinibacter ruber]|uniref:lecithin retinol acyltransferase family protein n=1 Tax=Salinibacter ruber TaxID=146919 RepID=UPI002168D898|nr:lecithin retinol acyltransferase family protein [Salinibacter ruber]MCS3827801.1 hypothetical protein [Salinibacter ruber]
MSGQDLVGEHVKASRWGYTHHGIYVRDGHVIQYGSGLPGGKIEEVTASKFKKRAKLKIVRHENRKFSPRETVRRAKRRLNEDNYSISFNNCEHFATWCVTGKSKSSQVEKALAFGSPTLWAAYKSVEGGRKAVEWFKNR